MAKKLCSKTRGPSTLDGKWFEMGDDRLDDAKLRQHVVVFENLVDVTYLLALSRVDEKGRISGGRTMLRRAQRGEAESHLVSRPAPRRADRLRGRCPGASPSQAASKRSRRSRS